MTSTLILLAAVALAVWLSAARPTLPALDDRDQERQLAELRAMAGSRADVQPATSVTPTLLRQQRRTYRRHEPA